MVGVPGRSKACHTCKQRKVLCSLEKPQCKTCLKASRVCLGYQRDTIFIHDPRTSGGGPKSYRKPKAVTDLACVSKKPEPWFHAGQNAESEYAPRFGLSTGVITTIISPSPHLVYGQQILGNFVSSSILTSKSSVKADNGIAGSWFEMLPTLPGMTTALETSVLAISTALIGRTNGDNIIVRESLKLYTRGLRELQRALWTPELMYKEGTCAASVALVMYEILECPDKSMAGWLSHSSSSFYKCSFLKTELGAENNLRQDNIVYYAVNCPLLNCFRLSMKGCAKLFELKGAGAFSTDFGHKLFISFRIMEIQQALSERRHTFLAGDDWIALPWQGREKTQLDNFLDIMVLLPNSMADGTALLAPLFSAPTSDPVKLYHDVMELLDGGWKLDHRLHAFYTKLETTSTEPLYWAQPAKETQNSDTDSTEEPVFPIALHFRSLNTAHLVMMYWASSAILWSGLSVTYAILAIYKLDANLPPLDHRADRTSLAKNICQAIEYCMLDEHETRGKTSAVFPLKVAIETLNETPGCERELAWAVDAMGGISGGGVRLMKFTGVPLTDHAYLAG